MEIAATTAVPAGSRVTIQFSGAIPVYLPDNVFKESFANQLRLVGLDIESITLASNYGLTSRDYSGVVVVRTGVPGKISGLAGLVTSAAENAGSYTPTVTIAELGQSDQPAIVPSTVDNAINDLAGLFHKLTGALGTAAEGVAKTPGEVATVSKLLIVGVVVLVAFVAFGPNLRGVGSNIRVG